MKGWDSLGCDNSKDRVSANNTSFLIWQELETIRDFDSSKHFPSIAPLQTLQKWSNQTKELETK